MRNLVLKQNKIFSEIKRTTNKWPANSTNRKDEPVLNKLRIDQTKLIHSFLMTKEDPPIAPRTELKST